MNTEDLFGLVRSGHLFAAVSPQALRQLHILRRFYCLDCPNTYVEVAVSDAGIARGQALDPMVKAVLDQALHPRVNHTEWSKTVVGSAAGPGHAHVSFSTLEDAFYYRGCLLHTAPRRCEYRRSVDIVLPSEQAVVPDTLAALPAPKLELVTGNQLQSVAVLAHPITKHTRHRCSVQVMSLPRVGHPTSGENAPLAIASSPAKSTSSITSPRKAADDALVWATPSTIEASSGGHIFSSPIPNVRTSSARPYQPLTSTPLDLDVSPSRQRTEAHQATKSSHPQCCFGIYCPDLPEESRTNTRTPERALFTSRRWLGLYWADGNAVASLALLGTVTTAGQPTAKTVQNGVRIAVGDVITIETRPAHDDDVPSTVLFFVNNKEVARVSIPIHMPVASHLETSYFGVMLSAGASVAVLKCYP